MILPGLHDRHDLELQSIASARLPVARATAHSLGGECRPDPEELSSKPTLRLEMLPALGLGRAFRYVTSQTAKVCLPMADSKEQSHISSLQSEYALKWSLALRWLPGCIASGHILPWVKSPAPEQACTGAPKGSCQDGTKCFLKKIKSGAEDLPHPIADTYHMLDHIASQRV